MTLCSTYVDCFEFFAKTVKRGGGGGPLAALFKKKSKYSSYI
jgi:hypothetical protein